MIDISLPSLYARGSMISPHIDINSSFHYRYICPLFSCFWVIFSWHGIWDFLWFIRYFHKFPQISLSSSLIHANLPNMEKWLVLYWSFYFLNHHMPFIFCILLSYSSNLMNQRGSNLMPSIVCETNVKAYPEAFLVAETSLGRKWGRTFEQLCLYFMKQSANRCRSWVTNSSAVLIFLWLLFLS